MCLGRCQGDYPCAGRKRWIQCLLRRARRMALPNRRGMLTHGRVGVVIVTHSIRLRRTGVISTVVVMACPEQLLWLDRCLSRVVSVHRSLNLRQSGTMRPPAGEPRKSYIKWDCSASLTPFRKYRSNPGLSQKCCIVGEVCVHVRLRE